MHVEMCRGLHLVGSTQYFERPSDVQKQQARRNHHIDRNPPYQLLVPIRVSHSVRLYIKGHGAVNALANAADPGFQNPWPIRSDCGPTRAFSKGDSGLVWNHCPG